MGVSTDAAGPRRGMSARLKLTLSYAGFLMVAGVLLLGAVGLFLRHYQRTGFTADQPVMAPPGGVLMRALAPSAAAVMGFLLVFGLVGGWFLAGRMLAPLTRVTAAARLVAGGSLDHRIRLAGRRDEFRELADAFDAMVARLEAHVAEERRFAANASHELRTPLAVSKALLDVARADPGRDTGALLERLSAVNSRAIDLTEALLLISRAGRRSFARERVDLSLLAEEAAETLLPLAERRGVALAASGGVTPAVGSPALLLQLAVNLVQNAIVHNLPAGGEVLVRAGVRGGTAVLTVENTGPAVDPDRIPALTEPFLRGAGPDGGRTAADRGGDPAGADHAGAGLGLAIARTVAEAHDGTLAITPRPGGGLVVAVALPGPSAHAAIAMTGDTRVRVQTSRPSCG